MSRTKINFKRYKELPSTRPLENGDFIVVEAGDELNLYNVTSDGEPKFIRGITEDQLNRLEQITQNLINKLVEGYTKTQIDNIVQGLEDDITNIIVGSSAGYISVSGNSLPSPSTDNNYTWLTSGTYSQSVGDPIEILENSMAIVHWNGTVWSVTSTIQVPQPVGTDTIDPEGEDIPKEKAVAKWAYSKQEYSYKALVDGADPYIMRVNSVDITDPEERRHILKKLDSALLEIEFFNLPDEYNVGIRQFNYNTTSGNTTAIFEIFDEEGNHLSDISNLQVRVVYSPEIQTLSGSRHNFGFSAAVTQDLNREFGSDRLQLNFREGTTADYDKCGIRNSFLTRTHPKSFLRTGARFITGTASSLEHEVFKHLDKAILNSRITSEKDELLRLQSVSWDSSAGCFLLFNSCIDDGGEEVDSSKTGFSNIRLYIPQGSGVQRLKSEVFTGSTSVEIEVLIDLSYLNDKIPVIFQSSPTLATNGSTYHWVVSPSSGGGGGGFFSQLTLLYGSDDFEGNYSFNSSGNNWSYNANYNMSKLIRIPDGANEIQFNMQFGANANADWIDENLKRIGKVHSGNNTVSNIKVDIPNDARFIRACTQTNVSEAIIIAYGEMEISGHVNTYRSLHEGLGDRYSGKIFKVGNVIFEKELDGLCTLYEYKSLNSFIDSIPEFELDGSKLQPLNIPYTGNNGTFDYGSFCAEKDGVLYFYNSRACAVFKTEDYGQTYTTISDKFSHPDLWDTQDVNNGQTSGVVIPLSDGEILFQVRHRGDKVINEAFPDRKERFFILCRTKNNQTDAEKVLTFSHEDTLRHWLDPSNPQYNWANHSGGVMLSDFTHDIWNDLIVVAEYGSGTSYYWQEKGVANNARGISGRAWASLDGGLTWKKFFDADRKINGLTEDDENWYWFSSTEARKMCHLHGIFIDKVNGVVHITNGDNEDYDWSVKVSDLKAWYQGAPSVDPDEHPEYKTTDTFPATDSFMFTHNDERWHNAYSLMKPQQMAGTPIEGGLLWGHDASREFAYVSRKTVSGEMVEPVFPFELESDYDTIQEFAGSWGSTDGFVQDIKVIDGVIFFVHSHSKTPSRIWASRDGYNWKIALEMPVDTLGFGAKIFKSNGSFYVSNKQTLADNEIGYWKLKEV